MGNKTAKASAVKGKTKPAAKPTTKIKPGQPMTTTGRGRKTAG
jgi:hypothetical protein